MLPVYERLFDVKYNFVIFPFILIGYALFCSTTQLMTKSTESYMGFIPGSLQKPSAGRKCIGHGLLSGKGFRGDHKQGGCGIQSFQGFRDVRPVNI
jgi:hypothetical protein